LPRTAIVVPAHNEECGIAKTLANLQSEIDGDPSAQVFVIADNCTDATARVAHEAGATVIERHDPNLREKGYALNCAFGRILERSFEAVIVLDADRRVDAGAIEKLRARLAAGADAVQARYVVANPRSSPRTHLMNVALLAFNVMRPRGRDRLGISCGILGNGFGLTRQTLEQVPYEAGSVVEDLEYHLRLCAPAKEFSSPTRQLYAVTCRRGDAEQGPSARWDGGRFRVIAESALPLAPEVASGGFRLLEPLLELLLPLAFHLCLVFAALAAPSPLIRAAALAQIGIAGVHVILSVLRCGGGIEDIATLAVAPFYIFWKLGLLGAPCCARRGPMPRVRTARESAKGGNLDNES
jgi:hypothetical protein